MLTPAAHLRMPRSLPRLPGHSLRHRIARSRAKLTLGWAVLKIPCGSVEVTGRFGTEQEVHRRWRPGRSGGLDNPRPDSLLIDADGHQRRANRHSIAQLN